MILAQQGIFAYELLGMVRQNKQAKVSFPFIKPMSETNRTFDFGKE